MSATLRPTLVLTSLVCSRPFGSGDPLLTPSRVPGSLERNLGFILPSFHLFLELMRTIQFGEQDIPGLHFPTIIGAIQTHFYLCFYRSFGSHHTILIQFLRDPDTQLLPRNDHYLKGRYFPSSRPAGRSLWPSAWASIPKVCTSG